MSKDENLMEVTFKYVIALDDKTRQLLYIAIGCLVLIIIIYGISLMTVSSNIAHAMHQVNIGSVQGQAIGEHNTINNHYYG